MTTTTAVEIETGAETVPDAFGFVEVFQTICESRRFRCG
jgi:hypothetical protein